MVALDLNANTFSGSIPEELYDATSLKNVFLATNLLSGTISPKIGQLAELVVLWLDGNNLSGEIPKEVALLTKLSKCEMFLLAPHCNEIVFF